MLYLILLYELIVLLKDKNYSLIILFKKCIFYL